MTANLPNIHITIKGIANLRERLDGSVDTGPILQAAGRGVSNTVIRHLRRRNARPGKPGWPKSNYWEDAASSVQTTIGSTSATVSIHGAGVRLHLKGGTVRPKSGKALAIPMRPEVAGIWPSEYSGQARVFLVVRKALGKAWLAEKQTNGHLRILWVLVKQTQHTADPTVLPSRGRLSTAVTEAVESILPTGANA